MGTAEQVRDVALTLRIKPEVARGLQTLSEELHISRTAVIALAVRELLLQYGLAERPEAGGYQPVPGGATMGARPQTQAAVAEAGSSEEGDVDRTAIRVQRILRNVGLTELARRAGVSRWTAMRWENGVPVSPESEAKLREALFSAPAQAAPVAALAKAS